MPRADRVLAVLLIVPAALLGGAIAFQYLGGLHPCEMCMWQRYALLATLAIGLAALAAGRNRLLVALTALALLADAAIAVFHAGVERHWWQETFTACTANKVSGSTADIVASMLAAPIVRCDAIAWSLFGISMAGWNAIIAGVTGLWALWMLRKA